MEENGGTPKLKNRGQNGGKWRNDKKKVGKKEQKMEENR